MLLPADKPRRYLHVALSPLSILALLLVLQIPWIVFFYPAWRHAHPGKTAASAVQPPPIPSREEDREGPWGVLRIEPIVLNYPSTHSVFDFDIEPYRHWAFRESTLADIRNRLAADGVNAPLCDELLQTAVTATNINGFVLTPPDAILRAFPPAVRAALYADFARDPARRVQAKPFMFCGASVAEWFQNSGVSSSVVAQIAPLVFPCGSHLLFIDPQLVIPAITSRFERVALYQALHRTATYRVRISLKSDEDPDGVIAYWSTPRRQPEIEPLQAILESNPEGLSILNFLPPFARARLYTYSPPPSRQAANAAVHDCHWTSLNFFNDPPDDRCTTTNIGPIFEQEYDRVQIPNRLGDVVLLFAGTRLVHSCVYLAGDIVFTKNGMGAGDPIVLEKLDEVVSCYRALYPEIHLGFCRRKDVTV